MTNHTAFIQLRPEAQITDFDSGTQSQSYRVELSPGEHFHINEMLYLFLGYLRHPTTLGDAVVQFQAQTGQVIPAEDLIKLEKNLLDSGVVVSAEENAPRERAGRVPSPSYWGIHWRKDILSPATLAPFTERLRVLFRPTLALGLLVVVMVVQVWAYLVPTEVNAISWPLLFVMMTISMFIHELGHLAACRYFGCPHGSLGVGLYFFNPVFYVDVTSIWRLNRRQRAVVDGGGIYFQLLTTPLLALLFWVTQDQTFLYAILLTNLTLVDNLQPFMKLDGYWLLSDLSGVPNLHRRSNELLQYGWGWLCWRSGRRAQRPQMSAFGQWSLRTTAFVITYVTLSVVIWPVLLAMLIPMLIEILRTYPALWQAALLTLLEALRSGEWGRIAPQLAALFLPTLILLNLGMLVKIALAQRQARQSRTV